ncbi:cytochrome b/b6 domain-containing protein [Thalassotalea profundi]|uniref:Cytochrome b561 n=1 Tax=Thalassotalea profundi TaxID=2036687 RepID=A0ABQ3J4V3_9GAMM|nr:cytochrome b/b6 domain-containing protein [Thalassotalea profundi]GHF02783.1 cytochrome b561 [Thalassotalea profundi]
MTKKHILIWDLPVRLFHWALVICLIGSWYTSEGDRGLIDIHMLFGYTILGLVIFRICWGFIGTKYAKFSQFTPNPNEVKAYIKDNNKPYLGHNPLGSLMVLFMLALLLLQSTSGLFMTDDIFTNGPYFDSVSKETQKFMSLIHSNIFDIIIIVSTLHIVAISYYLLIKKQNLITAMFTGKKWVEKKFVASAITHSKLLTAIILLIIVCAFIYWLVVLNIPEVEEFYY